MRVQINGDVTELADRYGNPVAMYTYDPWGAVTSVTDANGNDVSSDPTHIANINPIRYRGYYYDTETGFYFLQSRYYDPQTHRFINADGYVSTGQSILGYNMYAYCGNNPVNLADPSGEFWKEVYEFIELAYSEIKQSIVGLSWAYAGLGTLPFVDGPLPIGDVIAATGATALLLYNVVNGIYTASVAISEAATSAEQKDPPEETVIYRYGGTNPGNLTPSQRDIDFYPITGKGLPFSTVPKPGAAMTTVEALNATGVVYAVRDGVGHVSVYPIGGTLEDWHNAGSSSVWTTAVKSVVVKWDGEN